MPNNSESGHAANVANFNNLITFVAGYGEAYNPSNSSIQLRTMQEMSATAAGAIDAVNAAVSGNNAAVSAREIAFGPLSKLVTRIMSFLKASGVPAQVYDQVNTVARKVKGTRASALIKPETPAEGETPADEPRQVSVSQMSYDNRVANFGKLIQLLADIVEYNPNEGDLKTESLGVLNEGLKDKNNAAITAEVSLSNARIARNNILYTETTGLCDTALAAKNYVKAVFGVASPQYKQISAIKFTKH
jgi:hypothetical protein